MLSNEGLNAKKDAHDPTPLPSYRACCDKLWRWRVMFNAGPDRKTAQAKRLLGAMIGLIVNSSSKGAR
ncbi:hypothetical protein X907_1126 [Glycocaulis alkaliphilus]|uniref:Uncharacterized protein n=1 Tax=Glycocaulis alkaliphilus TaxID=1434191 RepID=A0A3T0E8M3_9PROT|nr:hypothetical protein X907_1126 [Glycocaulis alkaliphilus]GGB82984.1 hypothetical protein GCM10007417_23660 [Glycocaulis alkaliphilus]